MPQLTPVYTHNLGMGHHFLYSGQKTALGTLCHHLLVCCLQGSKRDPVSRSYSGVICFVPSVTVLSLLDLFPFWEYLEWQSWPQMKQWVAASSGEKGGRNRDWWSENKTLLVSGEWLVPRRARGWGCRTFPSSLAVGVAVSVKQQPPWGRARPRWAGLESYIPKAASVLAWNWLRVFPVFHQA